LEELVVSQLQMGGHTCLVELPVKPLELMRPAWMMVEMPLVQMMKVLMPLVVYQQGLSRKWLPWVLQTGS
jgi:hypothetical protein